MKPRSPQPEAAGITLRLLAFLASSSSTVYRPIRSLRPCDPDGWWRQNLLPTYYIYLVVVGL